MIAIVELRSDIIDHNYLSCIGNEYGDIYETQLTWAMDSSLNKDKVPEFWESLMKPIYHGAKL